jgi:hypothetical protein
LISIALQINPTTNLATDRIGLATHKSARVNECAKAIAMLEKLSQQVDVDDLLHNDTSLLDSMIAGSVELLKQARYDVSNYNTWVETKGIFRTHSHDKLTKEKIVESVEDREKRMADEKKAEMYSNKITLSGPKFVEKLDPSQWEKYDKKRPKK